MDKKPSGELFHKAVSEKIVGMESVVGQASQRASDNIRFLSEGFAAVFELNAHLRKQLSSSSSTENAITQTMEEKCKELDIDFYLIEVPNTLKETASYLQTILEAVRELEVLSTKEI